MKLGFIGAGKAGCSFSRYLQGTQAEISGFYSKTLEHSEKAAEDTGAAVFLCLKQVVSASDVVMITTPDNMIGEIWDKIKKQCQGLLEGKIFCHLSGSLSSELFQERQKFGAYGCSLHPMRAISSRKTDLSDAFFTAEGDQEAVALMKALLTEKKNPIAVMEPANKKKYHMAASAASNLMAGLAQMAIDSLVECGFDQRTALRMLTPLMRGNMENICEKGVCAALTGPVERGDWETVQSHLAQLEGEKREIYRLLSRQLVEVAQKKNETRDYSKLRTILEEKDQ